MSENGSNDRGAAASASAAALVVRPVALGDIDEVYALSREAGVGMTTLPADQAVLREKIERSMLSFESEIQKPGDEYYLFVMEDTSLGRVVGCSAIMASVGVKRPFFSFRVINIAHTSQELDKYEPVEALQMVDEYRGATEIATLFLTRDYRRDDNGKFLSRARLLFLAEYPERCARLVCAEMRGVQDDQGRSAFWENLGRHFTQMDFSKADYLSSLGNYQFISDLMPKHPVYIRLLPPEAQAVIGVPHDASRPAVELLSREGFRFEGCVDVFDAGPTLHCPRDQINTVRGSRKAMVGKVLEEFAGDARRCMISSTRLDHYLMCRGRVFEHENGTVYLESGIAGSLGVRVGDKVRYAPF
jgi:arginine N-succinyltransferase